MKTLTLYRPSVFENVCTGLDRYMESFFNGPSGPVTRTFMGRFPLTDVQETSCAYLIEAELPGYDEKSVDVHVNGGILTIESKPEEEAQTGAQEKPEPETPQSGFSFRERRRGTFTRSFKLPEDADAEQITAGFKNGILSLEIKKCAEARKRVIQIEKR